MAFSITWTDHAMSDLDQIANYIAGGSNAYACGFVRKIMARAVQVIEKAISASVA